MDHWFHGDGDSNAEMIEDAKAMGLDASELPDRRASDFVVWPENQQTVEVFLDCQTQWRTASSGVIGLDYAVVLTVANLCGAADPLSLLRDIQVMEVHARGLMNAEANKES